jgi:hypothetical protein
MPRWWHDERECAVQRERAGRRAVGTWLAAFGATAAVALIRPVDRVDEAWMLWVMERVGRGEVLYRDVYDVTTPLPAWIGGFVVRITASELLVLRGLVAAVVATQVLTACSIARHAGMQRAGRVVLAALLVACASPLVVFASFYTASAVLGALLALRALQVVLDRSHRGVDPRAPLVGLGLAVGLSFWCKPNIGLLALGAALVTLAVLHRHGWRSAARPVATVLGTFGVLSALLSLVLVASGAWSDFLDQVFASKGEYLDVGFSYSTAVDRRAGALVADGTINARAIVWLLVLAAPIVTAATIAWAVKRAGRRTDARLVAFAAFGIVGILSAVPRPGVHHLGAAMPLMLTAAAGAVLAVPEDEPTRSLRRGALAVGGILAAVACVIVAGTAFDTAASRTHRVTDLAHFSGTPVSAGIVHRTDRLRAGLRTRGVDEVFFVRQDAGFLHFTTGTRNPLPFDISERSDFGASGERGVIRRIARGDAPWICLRPARLRHGTDDALVPRAVERWVAHHTELVAREPMCELYRSRVV